MAALIAVLTAVTVPYFGDFTRGQILNQAVEQIRMDLRTVQSRAQNGIDKRDESTEYYWWGIEFSEESSYRLVQSSDDSDPNNGSEVRRTRTLTDDRVKIDTGDTIWFKMVTAEVYLNNTPLGSTPQKIEISMGPASRTITVDSGGRVQ